MKIAFFNNSLEPGRDGVGDYTRLLARECVRQGHPCCLIALNDRYVSTPCQADMTSSSVSELRLPADLSWPQRIEQAHKLLTEFAPDWVSLQFVPYGFHPKGFVYGLERRLQPLVAGRRVHIMFHELWLGIAGNSPWKDRAIGTVQKRLVMQMLKQIRPEVIHTSNGVYVNALQRQAIRASRLPMFGSIPITNRRGDAWLFAELKNAGIEITPANREKFWLLGFFGALHPVWPPEPLFSDLSQAALQQDRKIVLLSVGRLSGGEALWDNLAQRYASQFTFLRMGPLPVERVSEYFNSLDIGIATSPYSLIGKSSSVAAMLEHGLPVIVNSDNASFMSGPENETDQETLLTKLDADLSAKLASGLQRLPASSRLPGASHQFLNFLASHETNVGKQGCASRS